VRGVVILLAGDGGVRSRAHHRTKRPKQSLSIRVEVTVRNKRSRGRTARRAGTLLLFARMTFRQSRTTKSNVTVSWHFTNERNPSSS
jgi:hypothetical protein